MSTDAPARIWLKPNGSIPFTHPVSDGIEYVRSDVFDVMRQERDTAAEAIKEIEDALLTAAEQVRERRALAAIDGKEK